MHAWDMVPLCRDTSPTQFLSPPIRGDVGPPSGSSSSSDAMTKSDAPRKAQRDIHDLRWPFLEQIMGYVTAKATTPLIFLSVPLVEDRISTRQCSLSETSTVTPEDYWIAQMIATSPLFRRAMEPRNFRVTALRSIVRGTLHAAFRMIDRLLHTSFRKV